MATLAVTINGSASGIFKVDGFSIKQSLNNIDSMTIDVMSADASVRPAINDEIVVTENATTIFGGIVVDAREVGIGGYGAGAGIVTRVNAKGYGIYPQRRLITIDLAAGTLKSQLTTLVAEFASYGTTLSASQANGPSMPAISITTKRRGDDILNDLAKISGYDWRIDELNELRMTQKGEIAAPFNIADGDGNVEKDLNVTRTQNDLFATRIYVDVTSGPATDTIGSYVAADGVTAGGYTRFSVNYPASDSIGDWWPNELYIDGVIVGPIGRVVTSPQAWDVALAGWNWDMTTSPATLRYTVASGATFPVGAQVLTVNVPLYTIKYPFTVEAGPSALEATYGRVDRQIDNIPAGLSLDAAQAYADGVLDRLSPVMETATYPTRQTGIKPGMEQGVNSTLRDLVADILIQEVNIRSTGPFTVIREVSGVVSDFAQDTFRGTIDQWMRGGKGATAPPTVGVSGSQAAPPFRSVQFNRDGAFGGVDDVLLDEDFTGQSYGRRARLAVVLDDDNTGDALTLANRTGGLTHGLRLAATDDGGQLIYAAPGSSATYGMKLESSGGGIYITATKGLNANSGLRNTGYISVFGPWLTTECLQPSVWEVTTTPYTIDAYTAGGQPNSAHNEGTILWNRSSAGTINLTTTGPLSSPFNYVSGGSGGYGRIIWIKNIGSATCTIDPNSTQNIYFGTAALTTLDIAPGQGVQIQCYYAAGAVDGWHVIASTGFMPATLTAPGSTTQVLYNDAGVVGASSNFKWVQANKTLVVEADTAHSQVIVKNEGTAGDEGYISLNPRTNTYSDIVLGGYLDGSTNYIPAGTVLPYIWTDDSSGAKHAGIEVLHGETAGVASSFAAGIGFAIDTPLTTGGKPGLNLYEYGGLGTGAVPGLGASIDRNSSGNGAAGYLALYDKGGTPYYLWVESGKLRIHTSPPTEDNTTVAHTAGTVVGTQT